MSGFEFNFHEFFQAFIIFVGAYFGSKHGVVHGNGNGSK